MKITSNPKQQILIKSLRRQISIMIRNLHDFGFSLQEIHHILIEVIFDTQIGGNIYDKKLSQAQALIKRKNIDGKPQKINLLDFIISEIQLRQPSDKQLLKHVQNAYAQNYSLTEDSFITLALKIETKNATEHKVLESMKTLSKFEKKISRQNKNSYEETLYQRRSQLFERESMFRRKTSFQNDEQNWDDEVEKYENSSMNPKIDTLALMQQEVSRLKEMQKKYQQELQTKIVEKKKLLQKFNSPYSSANRSDFVPLYSQDQ